MIYMKAGDIQGDSGDLFHLNWIPVDVVRFGFRLQGQVVGTERPDTPERPTFDVLEVVKPGDSSSPALMNWMMKGEVLDEVLFEVCKEDEYAYMRYVLNQVKLEDYSVRVDEEKGAEVTLKMVYDRIRVEELSWTEDNESYYTSAAQLSRH